MKSKNISYVFRAVCGLVLLVVLSPATGQGAACTWGGSANGDWFDATKWVGSVPPTNTGDSVSITNGSVLLTNSTPYLSSFLITNASLTFSNNWNTQLIASNVTVAGTLTHAANLTTTTNASGQWIPTNRVYVVCTNFTLTTSGMIDVSTKGFLGGPAYGATSTGCGPGGGKGSSVSNQRAGGGGHGGKGGDGTVSGGPTNDVVVSPMLPGSGGGFGWASCPGGSGGGLVCVQASGQVLMNGTINADGSAGTADSGGGGSGGGVWISCSTFIGTNGLISANGGDGGNNLGGGGGGGCIAVTYDPTSETGLQPTVRFSVKGGKYGGNSSIGTLYFSDTLVLLNVMLGWNGRPSFPSATNWAPNSLTISNGWLAFPAGFSLNVTNDVKVIAGGQLDITNSTFICGGSLTVTGSTMNAYRSTNSSEQLNVTNNVILNNGTLSFWYALTNPASLMIGGNLTLTNSAKFYLYSGPTNMVGTNYGGLLDLSGRDLTIPTNCTIYCASEPTNGGSLLMKMQNLSISNGGAINGDGLGFTGGTTTHTTGYGTGGGSGGASIRAGGGGHGGKGGDGSAVNGGPTNDVAAAPMLPGSGGGVGWGTLTGGAGGSLVRIESSGQVVVNGRISADGVKGSEDSGGGGAGGGIYLICKMLSGSTSGVLSTMGGTNTSQNGGGGGGGRIAVWTTSHNFDDSLPAQPSTNVLGSGISSHNGSNGTFNLFIDPNAPRIDNTPPAINIFGTTVDVIGNLTSTGSAPTTVKVYWGTSNGFGVASAWTSNQTVGTFSPGYVTNHLTGLTGATLYYYRFYATNSAGDDWGNTNDFFTTLGSPDVNNAAGATSITVSNAVLQGFTQGTPTPNASIYWGTNDGLNNALSWSNRIDVGPVAVLNFSGLATGLVANQTYYYRCFASNINGGAWAILSTNFTTGKPTLSISDVQVTKGTSGTTITAQFPVSISYTSAAPVTVDFHTSNGTAVAGTDYVTTNGTLTIPVGSVSGNIPVTVIGTNLDQWPSVDFYVNLSNVANAVFANTQGHGVALVSNDTAQARTWSGTNVWTSLTNWSPAGSLPSPSDTINIPSGTVCTLSSTARVTDISVAGSLVFSGLLARLEAVTVTIQPSGTVSHAVQTATTTNALGQWVADSIVNIGCTNFTLMTNGLIDVSLKGFMGSTSTTARQGFGPGGGRGDGTYYGGGGSYGGLGGQSDNTGSSPTYGLTNAPGDPGSGGGCKSQNGSIGGNGGGYVRIQATGQALINGTINADGGGGIGGDGGGGGSGGGVWISCSTFSATNGAVSASGGDGCSLAGGGGGGRIAVTYDPAAEAVAGLQPTLRFSTKGGSNGGSGGIGTLYFSDTHLLPNTMLSWNGRPSFPSATTWAPNSLTLSNGWIGFPAGFALNVTNDLKVIAGSRLDLTNSTLACGGSLTVTGSTMNAYRGINSMERMNITNDVVINNGTLSFWYALTNPVSLMIGGTLTLTNSGKCYLYSGLTNAAGTNYGGLFDLGSRDLTIPTNCTLYLVADPTNGGAILMRVNNLTVSGGGAINSDGLGFLGGVAGHTAGYGPGGGQSGTQRAGGGGHGGKGGNGADANGGQTNDVMTTPILPGSGGAWASSGGAGVNGGGVVRIEAAGGVRVDGVISARGATVTSGDSPGGGAGGSLYLNSFRIDGSGLLAANGGSANTNGATFGGGGGGGRIAVWTSVTNFTGTVNVNGGSGYATGDVGTVFWNLVSLPGTVYLIR